MEAADKYLAEELVRDQHGPLFWRRLTDEGREYYIRRFTDAIQRANLFRAEATEAAS